MKNTPLKMEGVIRIMRKHGVGAKDGLGKNRIKLDLKLISKIVNTTLKVLRNCCKTNTENSLILFNHSSSVFKFLGLGTYA
jgi:hypothetical protein